MNDSTVGAIIAACGAIMASIIKATSDRRKRGTPTSNATGALSHVGSISGSVINVNSPQALPQKVETHSGPEPKSPTTAINDELHKNLLQIEENKPKPVTNLTHKEICDTIEAATPYHQDKINKEFIGRRVKWRAKLDSISHYKNEIWVSATMHHGETRTAVRCTSQSGNGDVFITATADTQFDITGDIDLISRAYVKLVDCTFEIIKPASE